jgi:hypothetical protein
MTPDWQFWLNLSVQAGVALGTIAVAVVALFGQGFRAKFFPPILRLSLKSGEGVRTAIKVWPPGAAVDEKPRDTSGRYYHVTVSNERRWSPANRVQVYLTRLEQPGPDGNLQLVWFGDIPIQWRNQEVSPLARSVGPDADVDLCLAIKAGDNRVKSVELRPLIAPYDLQTRYDEPSHLVLTLEARGTEGNSLPLRVKIAWDGEWHDGDVEMKRHFVASEMPSEI